MTTSYATCIGTTHPGVARILVLVAICVPAIGLTGGALSQLDTLECQTSEVCEFVSFTQRIRRQKGRFYARRSRKAPNAVATRHLAVIGVCKRWTNRLANGAPPPLRC